MSYQFVVDPSQQETGIAVNPGDMPITVGTPPNQRTVRIGNLFPNTLGQQLLTLQGGISQYQPPPTVLSSDTSTWQQALFQWALAASLGGKIANVPDGCSYHIKIWAKPLDFACPGDFNSQSADKVASANFRANYPQYAANQILGDGCGQTAMIVFTDMPPPPFIPGMCGPNPAYIFVPGSLGWAYISPMTTPGYCPWKVCNQYNCFPDPGQLEQGINTCCIPCPHDYELLYDGLSSRCPTFQTIAQPNLCDTRDNQVVDFSDVPLNISLNKKWAFYQDAYCQVISYQCSQDPTEVLPTVIPQPPPMTIAVDIPIPPVPTGYIPPVLIGGPVTNAGFGPASSQFILNADGSYTLSLSVPCPCANDGGNMLVPKTFQRLKWDDTQQAVIPETETLWIPSDGVNDTQELFLKIFTMLNEILARVPAPLTAIFDHDEMGPQSDIGVG